MFPLFLFIGYAIFAVTGTPPACTANSYLLVNPVPVQPTKQSVSEPHRQQEEPEHMVDPAPDEYYDAEEEFDRDLAVALSASLEGALF